MTAPSNCFKESFFFNKMTRLILFYLSICIGKAVHSLKIRNTPENKKLQYKCDANLI